MVQGGSLPAQTFLESEDDPDLGAQWNVWSEMFENDLVAWTVDDKT